ncbi:efflux RND transporter periplasmic adaptor subunit [Paenibacillus ehimensis]|uniref:Efflux RND transporter periplasmic adaptor subunit n=1 Tax=Paenibacillus ehimensis TaxID=79264 RepID=A0ABT8V7V8_9BACL|nr:efflux RND transporter periplasmic adaptor subunit [Paenibacillus ehimensis]MDO3675801.1 efflux RND transporter periplasmic adaptor subunit [Paenibacillus ehimensis]
MKKVSKDMAMKKALTLRVLAVLAAAALLAAGCSAPGAKGEATVDLMLDNRPVKTEAVAKRKISDPREQVAEVVGMSAMDVIPKASGQITQVLKKRGDVVQAGEVLFRIDNREAESTLKKSQIKLKSSEQTLAKSVEDNANSRRNLQDEITKAEQKASEAEKDYNKMRNDFDAGQATQRQVEQAEQALNNARMDVQAQRNKLAALDKSNSLAEQQTEVESSRISLEEAQRSLENYDVKAPVSGVLTDFTVELGGTVSPNGKVGQVQQIDPIKLKVELSEPSYELVKNKQELAYYSPDNPADKGMAKITFLSNVMSAATKSYSLELEVQNADQKLKPGTRAVVQLTTEAEEQVAAVPTLSIVREESNSFVFVLQGDTVQKRKIKLGRISDAYQEVLEGVKEGEQIVTSGQHQLKDGQKVEVAKPAPQGQPSPAAQEPAKK